MKRLLVGLKIGVAAAVLSSTVLVSHTSADLTDKLVEKGVVSQAEAAELRQESALTKHEPSFAWLADEDSFKLQLYCYGQVRYTFQDMETEENTNNFSVQRARLGVRGPAFSKDFHY